MNIVPTKPATTKIQRDRVTRSRRNKLAIRITKMGVE
jgi:hypothetical protein